jgi:hypothetical protein
VKEKFPTVESIYGRFTPLARQLMGLPSLAGDPVVGDPGAVGVAQAVGAGDLGAGGVAQAVGAGDLGAGGVAQAVGSGDGGAGGVVAVDGAGGSRAREAAPAASLGRRRPSYAAYAGFTAQVNRRRSKTGCKPPDLLISKHEDRDGDGKEGGNDSRDLGIGSSSSSSAGSSGGTPKNGAGSSGLSNNVASALKIKLCAKIVDKCDMSLLDDKSLVVTIIVVKSEEIYSIESSIESVGSSRVFADQIEGDLEAVSSNRLAISTILEVQSQGLMLNGVAMESPLFYEMDSARAVMVSAAMPQFAEESY